MTKCTYCDQAAVIRLRYARLRLCPKHFSEYLVRRVSNTLRRYRMINRGERVLVAVSGGKDSATLAHVMCRLSEEMGLSLVGLHIDLGIGRYSEICSHKASELMDLLKISHVTVRLRDVLGGGIPKLARLLRRNECGLCGLIKRYVTNYVAWKVGANKVATGHTLDDLVQYILKSFLIQDLERLRKLLPFSEPLPELRLAGRIKPLSEVSEKETMVYAYVNKLPFTLEECPLVRWGTLDLEAKRFMKMLEDQRPGFRVSFLRKFVKNVDNYKVHTPSMSLRKCSSCGMVSSGEICAFCRIVRRLGLEIEEVMSKLDDAVEKALS